MNKALTILLCCLSARSLAYVPSIDRISPFGKPPSPSTLPVRGPIRPKSVSANEVQLGTQLLLRRDAQSGTVVTKSIFWGKSWTDGHNASEKIAELDLWYAGFTGSHYSHLLDEYEAGSTSISYEGHVIDETTPPSEAAFPGFLPFAAVKEICNQMERGRLPGKGAVNIAYNFPVYVDQKRPHYGACAIRGFDTCPTMNPAAWFSYTVFYDLDGDKSCDVADTNTGHSEGLAALANASARATAELLTNRDDFGYYDLFGNEVDDKCAWTFNVPFVIFTNGSIWKLQGLWSNAAHESGTGYPNANGEKGCVDGR